MKKLHVERLTCKILFEQLKLKTSDKDLKVVSAGLEKSEHRVNTASVSIPGENSCVISVCLLP